ncbi:hypothetical protein CMO95_01250 [Candidatus Woesearchaeota archaeon]|nr:hypothetical protein [Candidatus Woesearchaeota archaeon]|tara:strand:+ start:2801 stop:3163 length:363 start_codon:yes stop_codon:yes gene_type:complete
MAQVVMALDFSGMEDFDFNNIVTQWFIDNEVQVKEESFSNGKDILNYNHYEKFNVVIFNFDNLDGDYFSELFYTYLNCIKDPSSIKVSLAEEGQFGFETLVETTLDKFLEMLNTADGEDE